EASATRRHAILEELTAAHAALPQGGMSNLNLAIALMMSGSHDAAVHHFSAAERALPDKTLCTYFSSLNNLPGRPIRQITMSEADRMFAVGKSGLEGVNPQAHYALLLAALIIEYYSAFGMASGKPPIEDILAAAVRAPVDRGEIARLIAYGGVRDARLTAFLQ